MNSQYQNREDETGRPPMMLSDIIKNNGYNNGNLNPNPMDPNILSDPNNYQGNNNYQNIQNNQPQIQQLINNQENKNINQNALGFQNQVNPENNNAQKSFNNENNNNNNFDRHQGHELDSFSSLNIGKTSNDQNNQNNQNNSNFQKKPIQQAGDTTQNEDGESFSIFNQNNQEGESVPINSNQDNKKNNSNNNPSNNIQDANNSENQPQQMQNLNQNEPNNNIQMSQNNFNLLTQDNEAQGFQYNQGNPINNILAKSLNNPQKEIIAEKDGQSSPKQNLNIENKDNNIKLSDLNTQNSNNNMENVNNINKNNIQNKQKMNPFSSYMIGNNNEMNNNMMYSDPNMPNLNNNNVQNSNNNQNIMQNDKKINPFSSNMNDNNNINNNLIYSNPNMPNNNINSMQNPNNNQYNMQNNIINNPFNSNMNSNNNNINNNVDIQSNAVLNAINNNQINKNIISNMNINDINNPMSNPNLMNKDQQNNFQMQMSNMNSKGQIDNNMNNMNINNPMNNPNIVNNNQQNNNPIQMSNLINNNIIPGNNNAQFNNNNMQNNFNNNPQIMDMSDKNQMNNMNINNNMPNNIPNNAIINDINQNDNQKNPINQANEDLNKNKKAKNEKYSFSRYKTASKTGLVNLGDTSYLNSVLQLLGNARNLASYFVNPNNKKFFVDNVNNASLSFVIHRLFLHFYPYPETNPQVYKPDTLLQVLGRLNQVYKTIKRRNPNDLILFILNFIHREINLNKIKYITNVDHTDKNMVINSFLDDFQKSNNSIISRNFHWFELKTQQCSKCSKIYYYINNYETLELDLEKCSHVLNNNPLTIDNCLQIQSQRKQNIFCEYCQIYIQMKINTRILSSPNYFVFLLNRESTNKNIDLLKIPFYLQNNIDIDKFLENKSSFKKYELQGIVSISQNENKYVCFGKSPVDLQWYLYNDEKVDNIDIQNVFNLHNNQVYIPCILLYKFLN